jgi:DNA mismatch repair protein MutL
MSVIRILPDILSNKIAAGEVVERPASVVKELMENAIDAGSTKVTIEVKQGGRSLIRVSDNGHGMSHDDALLAIERYATSKIYQEDDLFAIQTLGFRGEALPSIASVSRFTLTTRAKDEEIATEIQVEGGQIKRVTAVGAPNGTMVTVKNLFFNTPARRKFLKTIPTEMGHITDTLAAMALGWPQVQFRLLHNGREIKNWPPAENALDRVVDLLGQGLRQSLVPIQYTADTLGIDGWIGSPAVTRTTSRSTYVFVNGRSVRDRTIQHALFEGYRGRLVKGQYPVAVVFLQVPHHLVDVNVHPTKSEVRFGRQKEVHDRLRDSVAEALAAQDHARWGTPGSTSEAVRLSEPTTDYGPSQVPRQDSLPGGNVEPPDLSSKTMERGHPPSTAKPYGDSPALMANQQPALWERRQFGDLNIIGQFHETYIVCESEEGLILIDQHAAHERVVYERIQQQLKASPPASQRLLIPETIELTMREAEVLGRMLEDLNQLGLEIEPFGRHTFVVKRLPAVLQDHAIQPLILEIVEKMIDIGYAPGLQAAIDDCVHLIACHGAIRANQPLTLTQIEHLLTQLDACEHPSNCPHGRPTWVKWSLASVEKAFKRIV